jgi:putative flippase GtrA
VPVFVQFAFYTLIGGFSAIVNFVIFMGLLRLEQGITTSALTAFFVAAFVNYYLSILLLFRHRARWRTGTEIGVFLGVVMLVGAFDLYCTRGLVALGVTASLSKLLATALGLVFNFAGRRFLVFPEKPNPDWNSQNPD